jgi:hypothetical protein
MKDMVIGYYYEHKYTWKHKPKIKQKIQTFIQLHILVVKFYLVGYYSYFLLQLI